MTTLAVDTSGNHLALLLIKDGEVLSSYVNNVLLKHSVTLLLEIENMLEKLNMNLSDVDVFCAVIGPGSFTGIRIGVSTVKALAYSLSKKVLAVTSFEVLAYNKNGARVLTAIDARHQNFYVCGFDNGKVIIEPCFVNLETLKNLSKGYHLITDTQIEIPSTICDIKTGLLNAVLNKLPLANDDIESLIPLYVKKSQAEEELK